MFSEIINALATPFQYNFVILAIIGMIAISLSSTFLGNYIVHKKIHFIIPTVSHSAFAGLAFAMLLGQKNYVIAIIFVIIFTYLTLKLKEKLNLDYESSLSVLFISTMALGILFINLKRNYDPRIYSILFGNIFTLTTQEIFVLISLSIITILFFILFFRGIEIIIFDDEFAKYESVPVKFLNSVIFILIALTIVYSIKAIGTILIFAYFILPPLIAYEITHNFKKLIIFSFLSSLIASFLSIYLSFYFNISSGTSMVLILLTLYFIAIMYSPKKRCKECKAFIKE